MTVVVILLFVWAWALVPPWLANRRRSQDDPVIAFARFQGRDLPVRRLAAPRSFDRQRRRQQVLAALLVAIALSATTHGVVQQRWALGVTAAAVHLTVAWYAAVVRLRLRPRIAPPIGPVVTPAAPALVVLLPAA